MKWISVKDRMPEYNTEVLLYYSTDIVQGFLDKNDYWYGSRDVRDCMNDGWVEDSKFCRRGGPFDYVTHWMPLPEPPKI